MASPRWLFEFEKFEVMRGARRALFLPSLHVALGESLAVLGPNGAGKSTLMKAIDREVYPRPRPGLVFRILGETHWNVFELRRSLGIVTADLQTAFTREMTGEEMLLSGFFSSIGLWPDHRVTPAMRRRVRSLLRWLEVPHLARRLLTQMSSGESRRLLIGRALVYRPKALLLDEPCTSLDLRASHALRELLGKIARSGTGIVMVTHQITDVIPEIRRVLCLKAGALWKEGPKEKILTSRVLSQLFAQPLKVAKRAGYFHAW